MLRWMILPTVLLVGACSEPVFLECDGGRVVDDGDAPRCVYEDAGDGTRDAGSETDAGEDPTDAGDTTNDGGGDSGTPPGWDAPDALSLADCAGSGREVLDLVASPEAIHVGEIDGEDHVIPTVCGDVTSADRDVLCVRAPVRSIVEVIVEREDGGSLSPVIETFDEGALFIQTYQGAERRARTLFIQHAPPPQATYVMLYHADAYQNLCDPPPPSFRGGDDYGYTLTARICDSCMIEELGTIAGPTTVTATLDAPGGVHVVRFLADPGATPTVEVGPSDTACPSELEGNCCPIVVPLKPGNDTEVRATYTNTNRSVPTQCSADLREFPPSNSSGERLLAIYDFNGIGAAGYTVNVTITP